MYQKLTTKPLTKRLTNFTLYCLFSKTKIVGLLGYVNDYKDLKTIKTLKDK